jgi:hypothetical protein
MGLGRKPLKADVEHELLSYRVFQIRKLKIFKWSARIARAVSEARRTGEQRQAVSLSCTSELHVH